MASANLLNSGMLLMLDWLDKPLPLYFDVLNWTETRASRRDFKPTVHLQIFGWDMNRWIQALESRRLMSASPYSGSLQVVPELSPGERAIYTDTVVLGTLATLEGVVGAKQLKARQLPKAVVHWGDRGAAESLFEIASSDDSVDAIARMGHVYRHAGTYAIKTAFYFHGRRLGEVMQTIDVLQNSPGGTTIRAVAGEQFTQLIGAVPTASTESVQLLGADWGDGSMSSITIQNDNGTTEQIVATHAYEHAGKYRIVVRQPLPNTGELGIGGPIVWSTAIVSRRETK